MSHHFSMGAINKLTNEYEYPKIAEKGNKYMCPECKKDVNFCTAICNTESFIFKRLLYRQGRFNLFTNSHYLKLAPSANNLRTSLTNPCTSRSSSPS